MHAQERPGLVLVRRAVFVAHIEHVRAIADVDAVRVLAEVFDLHVIFAGDLALAVPQPSHSNLPLVLRRGTDTLWYVDEPKAWTYFHRFEDGTNFFIKYADNPFVADLRALKLPNMSGAIYGNHARAPTPPGAP